MKKLIGNRKSIDLAVLLVVGVLVAVAANYFFNVTGEHAMLILLVIAIFSGTLREKRLSEEIKRLKDELAVKSKQ